MKINYYYKQNNQEGIVYYILCYLIYISTFYIAIKVIDISIALSLVLFCILSVISSVYIFNINKYSIFKYDIIIFILIFYYFSIYYTLKTLSSIWHGNLIHSSIIFAYAAILLTIINNIIITLKISKTKVLNNYRTAFILFSYIYITLFIIISFSCIFINTTNNSLNNYINNNFIFDKGKWIYVGNNEVNLNNYFSYNANNSNILGTFTQNTLNHEQLQSFIKTTFNPVNKIEDYILFSTENYFSGSYNNITIHGCILKYILIIQKLIFIIVTLITMISLIDIYRLKEDTV